MSVPKTFDEAVEELFDTLSEDDLHYIRSLPPNKIRALGHHTVGRAIRNNWGFWTGEGELFHHMKALGFTHPDDMSGAIIDAVICKVQGKEFNLDAEIQRYKEYWGKMKDLLETNQP